MHSRCMRDLQKIQKQHNMPRNITCRATFYTFWGTMHHASLAIIKNMNMHLFFQFFFYKFSGILIAVQFFFGLPDSLKTVGDSDYYQEKMRWIIVGIFNILCCSAQIVYISSYVHRYMASSSISQGIFGDTFLFIASRTSFKSSQKNKSYG